MKKMFAVFILCAALGAAQAQLVPPTNKPPAAQPPVTPPPIPVPPPPAPPPAPPPTWFAATCWTPIIDGQPWPEAIKRFVAKNSNYKTRPAYPIVNGDIGPKEAARATVGEACDCYATTIVKGTTTYCAAPKPNAALVTVCREP